MKNKKLSTILLLIALLIMVAIWLFSSQNGESSSSTSNIIVDSITNESINNNTYQYISFLVRKSAHFIIYLLLAAVWCGYFLSEGKIFFKAGVNAFVICSFYAFIDEFHQSFVPERSCSIYDAILDSAGSLAGISILLLILSFVKYKKKRY